MSRLIVANLDAEADWARKITRVRPELSGDARRLVGALGTTLRVFAEEGDRLVTASDVAPERVASIAGVPDVEVTTAARATGEVLSWGETEEIERMRAGPSPRDGDPEAPLHERVWRFERARPPAAARVNDRAFLIDVATKLGAALPGARLIESMDDLEHHLAESGADASPDGRFVLKACFSAAGRARAILDGSDFRPAERLLGRWGRVLFEPWMERTADFGCLGVVTRDAVELHGIHGQDVDDVGRFSGLVVHSDTTVIGVLSAFERLLLEETTRAVGERLREEEYFGPFSVDAWRYVVDGREVLHPLGEINARLTMGFVARAWAERLADRFDPAFPVRLAIGRGAPPVGSTPLLLPGERDPLAAWLEPAGG